MPNAEEERLKRLRREMREQDERRFQDPDYRAPAETIYVLLVWLKKQWKLVSHTHGKITPKRVSQLRRKFRRQIPEDSIVRLVDIRTFRLYGAGAPPQAPPRSNRSTRLAKQTAKVMESKQTREQYRAMMIANGYGAQIEYWMRLFDSKTQVKRRRIPADKKWGKCWKCSHRSLWYVAFNSRGKRILRKCCTRHAWHDQHLPSAAKCVVVVQRRVGVRLAA